MIDFLVGEKDGVPKDPNYIYRLYLALKKYEDAAKTAMIIARQEQDLGNYALSHKVIVETIRHLEDANIKVSLQLRQSFVLLHSYTLVKLHVKRGYHLSAARLLLRVAQNVSKFPMHIVQILTSTVIECQRAGLKASSYEYAAMLVRPEYRSSIDPNLKRKIEGIVRRKSSLGEEETPEETTPCPLSNLMIPVTQLECPTTRDALPMCIISGKHMVLDDWCFCPISKFPALYSEYVKYIRELTRNISSDAQQSKGNDDAVPQTDNENNSSALVPVGTNSNDLYLSAADPILGKSVSISDLVLCSKEEAMKYIQRYNNVIEKKKDDKDKDEKDTEGAEKTGEGAENNGDGKGGDDNDDDSSPTKGSTKEKKSSKSSSNSKESKISKAKFDRIQRSRRKRNELNK